MSSAPSREAVARAQRRQGPQTECRVEGREEAMRVTPQSGRVTERGQRLRVISSQREEGTASPGPEKGSEVNSSTLANEGKSG